LKIKYKIIENERVEDAPFIGALISAIDCNFNCKNCFNQHIKQLPILVKEDIAIIEEIKSNPFNKGIIFGGLEWSLQPTELFSLALVAHGYGLQTMLYTGNTFEYLQEYCSIRYLNDYFDYIKCGQYEEDLKTINHIEYGVTLSSNNQHIYKNGIDY
jgi:pyruvate-formate lyase-activating enzyme